MGMNINLTPQLEEMIRPKVDSGMYNSASEVVRDALRLMDEKDRLRAAKLDQLREEIQEGLSAARPQPGIERRSSVRGGRRGPAIPAPPKHKCRSSSSVPALSMI